MDHRPSGFQHGAALISALFILVALLLIGASAAHTALDAELATRAERDRQLAFQAAEAALADAERDIEGGSDPASARAALFESGNVQGFTDGCGRSMDVNAGLCALGGAPAWQANDLAADGEPARAAAYGRFTGATMPVGQGALPARLPRYLIEAVPDARAGQDADRRRDNLYRITAIGFGVNDKTRTVLQAFYRRVPRDGEAP